MKTCFECNQECCKNVIIEMDAPETKEDWEEIKWQVAHDNIRVIKDNDDAWCVEFIANCSFLGEDGLCKIYENRPGKCKDHSSEKCIINGEGEYYEIIFETIEDVKKYLKEHPEAIGEEMVDVHTCPKCGCEFADEDGEEEIEN